MSLWKRLRAFLWPTRYRVIDSKTKRVVAVCHTREDAELIASLLADSEQR